MRSNTIQLYLDEWKLRFGRSTMEGPPAKKEGGRGEGGRGQRLLLWVYKLVNMTFIVHNGTSCVQTSPPYSLLQWTCTQHHNQHSSPYIPAHSQQFNQLKLDCTWKKPTKQLRFQWHTNSRGTEAAMRNECKGQESKRCFFQTVFPLLPTAMVSTDSVIESLYTGIS